MSASFTIPVALDSAPPADVDPLVRVIYFRITAEDPNTPMRFSTKARQFPFILLGLEGIILGPATGQELFSSAQDIDGLIDLIEGISTERPDPVHAFGTSSLWVPYSALLQGKAGKFVERGDVFRFSEKAFRKAWWFADNRVDEQTLRFFFLELSNQAGNVGAPFVAFSPIETKAFRTWSERHLRGSTP